MDSNLKELILTGFPTLWAISASIYIIFSKREKRLFLEWASVFRPWLIIPATLHALILIIISLFSEAALLGHSGRDIFTMTLVMASPILALLFWRHSDSTETRIRTKRIG